MNTNNYKNQRLRALQRKLEIIEDKGGCCQICGYNKNISALEFHHQNPKIKEFQLDARKLANTSLEKLKTELNKCILLCSNCHKETHYPDLEIGIIKELEKKKLSFKNLNGKVCPVCGARFSKVTGKIYCSAECKVKSKNYPTKEMLENKYLEIKSWEKVALHFNITRRIIQRILNNPS